MIGLFIILFFVLTFLPNVPETGQREVIGFLASLGSDDEFRNCVVAKNSTCISQTIDTNLPDNYEFSYNISTDATAEITGLPNVAIFSESLYLAGNITHSTVTIVRVFYWNR